jgi:DNA-binding NarL/FixJ family response regulator
MHVSKHIAVLLADDHLVVREGLRSILETEGDIVVVGQAQDGLQAVKLAKTLHPSVIVMDIAMPRLNGLEATRQILKAAPASHILVLSAHSEDAYVERAIALGATGYFVKQAPFLILVEAVREACKGHTFLSPSISKHLRDKYNKSRDRERQSSTTIAQLTSREVEVLEFIAKGKTSNKTALELGIDTQTVEKHQKTLMEKFQIHDIASLIRYALAEGIIGSSVQLTIV